MVALGNRVSEQLSRLGIPAEMMGAQLGNLSTAKLNALSSDLQLSIGGASTAGNKFLGATQDSRWNIAPALSNPTPRESAKERGAYVRGTYHRNRMPRHASAKAPFEGLLNKYNKQGAIASRMLSRDPAARKRFEKQAALTVVPDGRADGAVSVHAMGAGGAPSGGGVPANAWDLFAAMDAAIMEEAAKLGNIAAASSDIYGTAGGSAGQASPSGYFGGMGEGGEGYFTGTTSMGGNVDATSSTSGSTDEQTLVIKRMMDKRNQMYDLFKNVLDKHNESAKTAINNMRA